MEEVIGYTSSVDDRQSIRGMFLGKNRSIGLAGHDTLFAVSTATDQQNKGVKKTRKPKVAIMSYAIDNRKGKGTALYARKVIEHMVADDRFEVYLVHYDRVDDPIYTKAHEIIMPQLRLPFGTRFFRQLLFFWKYRNDGFDLMHWCQSRLYPFYWFAPATYKTVMAFGAGDVTTAGPFPLSRRMFNFVLTHFNSHLEAIVACSEFGKDEIVKWYGAKRERVYVIHLGGGADFTVLDKEVSRQRIQVAYGIEGHFILGVSMHTPHKNVPMLVRAYILARDRGITQKLVLVGGNGVTRKEAWDLAQASAYAADIMFIEYVAFSDLNALYSAADLFVFPTLHEDFGIPLIEAFASGTPVVTSNVTSLPEIAGDAAVTVNPYDPTAIADGICRVLHDHTLADSLVAKGIERAPLYTWDLTASRTANLFAKILSLPVV